MTGIVPPLTERAWQDAFDAYKTVPQWALLNRDMRLKEFKRIYFWEWGHRLLGRLIGIAFIVPFIFFWWRRKLSPLLALGLGGIFFLGALQGFLGWFMVRSGLEWGTVTVAPVRLLIHSGLAYFIYALLFLTALSVWQRRQTTGELVAKLSARFSGSDNNVLFCAGALVFLVYGQILLGVLTAAHDGGLLYNTWPLMDGQFLPLHLLTGSALDPGGLQLLHRLGAYVLWFATLFYACYRQVLLSFVLFGLVSFQAFLGIWTLLALVPVSLGVAHQFVALVVWSVVLLEFQRTA